MFENERSVNKFLAWFGISNSPASVSSYRYALRRFTTFLRERSFTDCTLEHVVEYIELLREEDMKEGTIAIYVTALRSFWKYLEEKVPVQFTSGKIPIVRTDNVKSHDFATPEEVMAILGTFSDIFPYDCRNKAMISLMWDTGVRLAELLSLNVDDIDLVNKRGNVKTYKRKGHRRDIFWEETTNDQLKKWLLLREEYLLRYGHETDALFLSMATNSDATRCHRHALQKALRDAGKRLGLKRHITPHSLRHGYCTIRAKLNMNVHYLQKLMGHAKLSSTQVYVHMNEKDLEAEYRQIYRKSVGV